MYSNIGKANEFNEPLIDKLFSVVDEDGDGALEEKEVVTLIMMAVTSKNKEE